MTTSTKLDGFDDTTQEIAVNEQGGRSSKLPYAFTSLDPRVLLAMAQAMAKGNERHGRDNWRKVSVDEHLNHALAHITAYGIGDDQEDHLGHAVTRLMMAKAVDEANRGQNTNSVRSGTNREGRAEARVKLETGVVPEAAWGGHSDI